MTTEHPRIARESIERWPRLTAAGLSSSYAVLTAEVGGYDYPLGVSRAAERLVEGASNILQNMHLLALVKLGSINESNRRAKYLVEKEGPWNLLATEALSDIPGPRNSRYSGSSGSDRDYYGEVHIELNRLRNFLVATWNVDSAVVCVEPADWNGSIVAEFSQREAGILESAAALLSERYLLVARGVGGFGSSTSGIDLVGSNELVNCLQRAACKITATAGA